MDDLLTGYTEDQLLSELEHGHYWYYDGNFHSSDEKPSGEHPTNVENAVYFRYYCCA